MGIHLLNVLPVLLKKIQFPLPGTLYTKRVCLKEQKSDSHKIFSK
jgi:hypothetical protein